MLRIGRVISGPWRPSHTCMSNYRSIQPEPAYERRERYLLWLERKAYQGNQLELHLRWSNLAWRFKDKAMFRKNRMQWMDSWSNLKAILCKVVNLKNWLRNIQDSGSLQRHQLQVRAYQKLYRAEAQSQLEADNTIMIVFEAHLQVDEADSEPISEEGNCCVLSYSLLKFSACLLSQWKTTLTLS